MFQRLERLIFPIIFLGMLLLPALFVNKKEGAISKAENRTLASPAKLYLNNEKINENYFQDMEKWFDDNLGFRDLMLKMDVAVQYYVFRQIKGMPLGRNGELAPCDLNDFQHKNLLSDKEIEDIVKAYGTINDYLESQGIQAYYLQCWDKHSIYPEQYPETIHVFGDVSKTDQVEKAFIMNSVMNVILIKDKLIAAKKEYQVYGTWAEPYHWIQRGAFIAYNELINAINQNNDNKYKVLTEDDFNISKVDIGMTYYGIVHEADVEECFNIIDPKAKSMPEKMVYIPEGGILKHATYYVNNAVDNEDTLLILGDSYFYGYGVFADLAESFHTTIMFDGSSAQGDHLLHIIDTYEPDIVVFENAERVNRFGEAIEIANQIKSRNYKNGEKILFYSDEANSGKYIVSGFYEKEEYFTWTEGESSCMFIYADDIEAGTKVHATFELGEVINGEQEVIITINGIQVFADIICNGENINFDFEMPKSQMITMKLQFPNACSPFELGINTDTRQLALQVQSLTLNTK